MVYRILYIIMKGRERTKKGVFTSAVGIACNLALAASKIVVGSIFGLVSVVADGFNNLSDSGSSLVSLISFYIADKPADKEHPFGHKRAEYIAAMITGFLVFFLATEIFRESVDKITGSDTAETHWVVFLVLGLSVAIKAGMFLFYRISAAKLGSDALKAAAVDSLCDCISTTAVIIGLIILQATGFPADGWAGIAVALFIIWQGIKIIKEASSKLLGQAPSKELTDKIEAIIRSGNGVIGLHDLRVYCYGIDVYFATAHVEMDASLPALDSHAVIDSLEQRVRNELNVELTVHFDPVDLKDAEMLGLESKVRDAVKEIAPGTEIHDFRIVRGDPGKVIFDVGVQYDCKIPNGEVLRKAEEIVRSLCPYNPVITVDRE